MNFINILTNISRLSHLSNVGNLKCLEVNVFRSNAARSAATRSWDSDFDPSKKKRLSSSDDSNLTDVDETPNIRRYSANNPSKQFGEHQRRSNNTREHFDGPRTRQESTYNPREQFKRQPTAQRTRGYFMVNAKEQFDKWPQTQRSTMRYPTYNRDNRRDQLNEQPPTQRTMRRDRAYNSSMSREQFPREIRERMQTSTDDESFAPDSFKSQLRDANNVTAQMTSNGRGLQKIIIFSSV